VCGEFGSTPDADLLRVGDDFYGTCFGGGAYDRGTVFRMKSDGSLVWSRSFDGTNGSNPEAGLTLGKDHDLYGTTAYGGANGSGAIIKVGKSGTIGVLYSFSGGRDGAVPVAGLVQGSDGSFYGTTKYGGLNGNGTVFKLTPVGSLTSLYSFGTVATDYGRSLDGSYPVGELVEVSKGCFYGTTSRGGIYEGANTDIGTIFKINSDGVFTSLYSLSLTEGAFPCCRLVQGADGKLYGTTQLGGSADTFSFGYGTSFRITTNGTFTSLFSFHGSDGAFPCASLTIGKDGSFYGTTAGGFYSPGTVFRFSIIRPILIITSPHHARPVTNKEMIVTGKAKGRSPVIGVMVKVNDGNWADATTSDGWTNWTASVTLEPGANIIRAYASDTVGDLSHTNGVRVFFIDPHDENRRRTQNHFSLSP